MTQNSLPRFVPWGSDPPCRFRRHPDVRIAHIGDSMLAKGGVFERDFRERDEGQLAYAAV